jgi:hypothetical protein
MKEISVRETRKIIGKLDRILDKEGALKITNHGKPIAIVSPVKRVKPIPSHRRLRESMNPVSFPSEDIIRRDRDSS